MYPRAIVRALVSSLGDDGDRYGGRIDATDTPSVAEAFVMVLLGFGVVWLGLGGYLEAAGHGRGGGFVVRWAKNGEKRALS